MDIMKTINQAKEIMLKPKNALQKYKDEQVTLKDTLLYLGIVGFPTFLGILIGYGVVGFSFGWGGYGFTYKVPLEWAFAWALTQYILLIIGVIVFAYVFDMLASSFSSKPNKMQSMKLVSYVATPVLIAGIFNIWPPLGLLGLLAAIYSFYILYIGLPVYMGTPNDKVLVYIIVSIIIYVVIYYAIGWVVSTVMWSAIGYNPYTVTVNYPGWY